MHLNIQSLKPKLDILEIESQPYDIMIFTETWLNPNIPNSDISIPNFSQVFRRDRIQRLGGGVAIYVRDDIYAVERPDLFVNDIEALWVEVRTNRRKIIVGGIYRPPDANNQYWQLMEQSIDLAFNSNCDNILVAGDFNINIQHSTNNKMSRLIHSYNAHQLIDTATHFTETSSSIIDLIFVKHSQHVLSSFVADCFIPDLIRFHCPVVCVLKFNKPKQTTYKRKIWLYDQGDYTQYRENLRNSNWEFINSDNLNDTADIIANTIVTAASTTIPNK